MEYAFDAVIRKHESLDAGFVEFPYDALEAFGKKDRIKVKARFDGFEYRGLLVRMGSDCLWIGLNRKVREAIGKNPGDTVHVTIEQDLEERTVEIPEDFRRKLEEVPGARAFFDTLSYTHRREYVNWIEEAKKQETRVRRIEKAAALLGEKKKDPR